jgi:serine protease AprX
MILTVQAGGENSVSVYPNPVSSGQSGSATIAYRAEKNSEVSIELWDLAGRKVKTLLGSTVAAGDQVLKWDASMLQAGVYFLETKVNERLTILKVVVE